MMIRREHETRRNFTQSGLSRFIITQSDYQLTQPAKENLYRWFAYDVIKNLIMQIMINLLQILIQPIRLYNVPLCQI